MPIQIQRSEPNELFPGFAFFRTDSGSGVRRLHASASLLADKDRPIELNVFADDGMTCVDLSIEEAEALISCLAYAVALRRLYAMPPS